MLLEFSVPKINALIVSARADHLVSESLFTTDKFDPSAFTNTDHR